MTSLVAVVVMIVAASMLVAYFAGHAVGRQEGFEEGRSSGKREGAKRAYAVGYDRGRHDRQAVEQAASDEPPSPTVPRWALSLLLSLIAIVVATLAWHA